MDQFDVRCEDDWSSFNKVSPSISKTDSTISNIPGHGGQLSATIPHVILATNDRDGLCAVWNEIFKMGLRRQIGTWNLQTPWSYVCKKKLIMYPCIDIYSHCPLLIISHIEVLCIISNLSHFLPIFPFTFCDDLQYYSKFSIVPAFTTAQTEPPLAPQCSFRSNCTLCPSEQRIHSSMRQKRRNRVLQSPRGEQIIPLSDALLM